MKRNSIFMWAYITFIAISILVRAHTNFPLWGAIVIAITVSSAFFAIEDFCSSLSKAYKDSLEITENIKSSVLTVAQEDKVYLDKVDETIDKYRNTKYDISDIKASHQELRRMEDEIEDLANSMDEDCKRLNKATRIYTCASYVFAFIGFLCLFVILVTYTFFEIPALLQEVVSVISFTIILITQQVCEIMEDRIKLQQKDSESVFELQKESQEKSKSCEASFNRLISNIEKYVKEDQERENTASHLLPSGNR